MCTLGNYGASSRGPANPRPFSPLKAKVTALPPSRPGGGAKNMQPLARQLRSIRVRQTTTFRLTAMLGAAFLCAMCLLLGLIYLLTERELVGRTDEVLQFQAKALAALPGARLPQAVRAAILADASHLNYFALLDARGHELAGNFSPPLTLSPGPPVEVVPRVREAPLLQVLTVPVSNGGLLIIGR